ncbi:MAG: hypothetical protein AAGH71_01330 [Planctomycetota bacterium]
MRWVGAMVVLPVASLAGSVVASLLSGRRIGSFLSDPRVVDDPHALTGVLSNLGICLWASAAYASLLAGWVLRRSEAHRETSLFLLAFGTLSLVLMVDDLMLVHEGIVRDWLGLPELLPITLYMLATFACLVRFASRIRREGSLLMVIALTCFAGSVGTDVAPGPLTGLLGEWRILVEDGLKLFGITAWAGFFARASMRALGAAMADA